MTDDATSDHRHIQPTTVSELLALIDQKRGPLEQIASNLPEDQRPVPTNGWSAAEHLAHVALWERRLIGEMEGEHDAACFGLDPATFRTASEDELNAMLAPRLQHQTAAKIRTEFLAAGKALRATVAKLADTDLYQSVRPDDPRFATLMDLIECDSFGHYPEHIAAIAQHE